LNLKRLRLTSIADLEDISGIFTMNSVGEVLIEYCPFHSIQGEQCRVKIKNMEIQLCSFIENIDFLLACENITSLRLSGGGKLVLPKPANWRIPNLLIFGDGEGGEFSVRKKEGKIIASLNLDAYLK
jgi:hypothetical protein